MLSITFPVSLISHTQQQTLFAPYSVPYETFDILLDEELRIALKSYSDWPTYPHVYVNGELIGGFETIKDLHESGELIDTLYSEPFKTNRRMIPTSHEDS